MTVCTVSMFHWFYGKDESGEDQIGLAFVTASDRMLTDAGLEIEYEGSRQKIAFYGQSCMVLVAGDLAFNSLVLQGLNEVELNEVSNTTTQLAFRLGDVIGALNSDRAFRKYLTPLGLSPTVIRQREGGLSSFDLPTSLVDQLSSKMQEESADSEFIVAGCDNRNANLLHVNGQGIVSSHTDIGFLSIGAGGIHSSAYFMQRPYRHNVGFHQAVADTFFAKKRAEICPGVGDLTDMQWITGEGISRVQVEEIKLLERAYKTYNKVLDSHISKAAKQLLKNAQNLTTELMDL